MMLIGLAGSAGSGKDTVADYLVAQHGFTKFSFSDALYREVSEAFSIPIDELKHRGGKELPHPKLVEAYCKDPEFAKLMRAEADARNAYVQPPVQVAARWVSYSPRWVLQHWGTEYRRAQDPDYWLKAASLWVQAWLEVTKDDGQVHGGLVNTSVRFPNELAWIDEMQGVVWHVRRHDVSGVASELQHVAEQELPVAEQDHILNNDGTIEELNTTVSLLLSAGGEPEAPPDVHPLVMCARCHKLHKAYTKEQVAAEVDLANSATCAGEYAESGWLDGSPGVAIDDYRGCVACGCDSFILIDNLGATDLSPVLFEGNI